MVLYFATEEVTNITISIPGLGYTQTLTSPAFPTVVTSAPIPKTGTQDARLRVESTAPEDKGIHITSDKPMVAYAHIYNSNVSGATILFPTPTLGKEYYSINYTNVSNENNSNGWFYVVATDTGTTTVEITPSANTINHAAGVPFTVNLTQGQIYNLMGQLTGQSGGGGGGGLWNGVDLTGSKIRSVSSGTSGCKRIAVFSGSGKIGINCGANNLSADNYMVQAFPKDAWGKKYLTAPTSSLNRNIYRICVLDPATNVQVNGVPISVPLTNNFYYEISATTAPLKIESDQPITVAQYIATQGACGNPSSTTNPGDPEVIYLSPVEQNIARVIWNATPNFNITQHYYNVVIKNAGTAISSFRLDGAPVNPTAFTTHPQDPAFSYLSQQLTASGVHTIESDSGFNAIAYGFGSAESYGYNAGTNIRDLYKFLQPLNPYSISPDPVACTGSPVYLTVTLPFQPTSLLWNFYNNPNQSPNNNVLINAPVADSTYFIGTKQVWRYRLPSLYTFSLANSTPGYPITITAGTTSVEGCGGSVDNDFDLAVYDPPVADFYWNHSGCVTDSVYFRDTTVYLAGTYSYKWFWDFGDGTTDSVRYPKHKYQNPGIYTVKFRLLSNVGCFSDTAIQQIIVTNIPTPSFTTSAPLCVGNTIQFNNTSSLSGPGSIIQWHWDFGDGNTSVIDTPANGSTSHSYSPFGNYSPSLWVQTISGCRSDTLVTPLYIGPFPVANFDMPAGICLPSDTASFTMTGTIADGSLSNPATQYQWTFGDPPSGANDTSLLPNPSHYYTGTGPFTITLTVTSNQGCVHDTSKVLSNVYAQPVASFTVAPENCLNDTTRFSSSSSGSGQAIAQWFWDFGDGSPVATGQNPAHVYATSGVKTITHWVQTDVGCFSDTATETVVINALPTAAFNTTGPYCSIRNVTFTSIAVPNSGVITQWNWNLGDGTVLNINNGTPFTHAYNGSGTYPVTLIVETDKGCVSPAITNDVIIFPNPVAGFINPEVCLSDSYAQFVDTTTVAAGSIIQWQWNFGNPGSGAQNTSTLQNPQHSYSSLGPKTVTLIVVSNQGCRDTVVQTFTVNGDSPTSGFNIVNTNALCANDSVRISNTSTVNVGDITKIEIYWDNTGAPAVFELDDNPFPGKIYAHLYPDFQTPLTRTYTIRFKVYTGATCTDDFTRTVTVNASPRVQFTSIRDTCLFISPFQITQGVELGGVPGSFVYTGPGVNAAGVFDPATVGPGTYTLLYTYTSAAGCVDTASNIIQILQPPIANFGFSTPRCETKTVTFRDSSSAPVGSIASWTWNFGDGTPPVIRTDNQPFTHVFTTAGTYAVQLLVTTNGGCNSAIRIKDVLIHPQPVPNFRFTDTACLPFAQIQFQNLSSISDGTQSSLRYAWNFGDPPSGTQNTSTAVNPSHTYTRLGPFNVYLRVTSAAGCVEDTIIPVNTIHPRPEADFSFSKPSVCIGDNVQMLDASDPKDGTPNTWAWQFGDGNGSVQQNPVHEFTNTGLYQVSLYMTNSFGCISDTAVKPFNVYAYPIVSAGPDLYILEGESQTIDAVAQGTAMTYSWSPATYLNNPTRLKPICTPTDDITYTLTVTGIGGCPTTDQVKIIVLKTPIIPNTFSPNNDGINDTWEIEYLRIYPFARVQVFTRTGQLVYECKGTYKPWDGTLSGKILPMDTYYYIIEPESGREPVTGYITIIR